MRLFVSALALAVGGTTGDAAAQWWTEHPAESYCNAAYEGQDNRATCLADQFRAASYVFAYGSAYGYFTDEGRLNRTRILRDHVGFRAFLGLAPKNPFARCLAEVDVLGPEDGYDPSEGVAAPFDSEIFAPFDMGEVWECMKREDPEAAQYENP